LKGDEPLIPLFSLSWPVQQGIQHACVRRGNSSMKAIVIHRFGPPEVLSYEEVPDPVPGPGEICVRIHAATVNRVLDVSLRAGKEGHRGAVLPLIPGVDCAGTVEAVGAGVTRWKVGDRVAAAGVMPLAACSEDGADYQGPTGMMGIKRPGGFAEKVAVPACAAVALPEGLDFHAAAVITRHVPTAWNLLVNVAALKPKETVLVMGAGGNLGTIGIQIAKHVIGATVIAAAGSAERVKRGLALGADHGINYAREDIHAEVMRITKGAGVDVLYDNIANPAVLPAAFRAIGMKGRLVTAGAHAGPNVTIDFAHLYHKRITIKGEPGYRNTDLPQCFAAAAAGKIKPQIWKVLPLSQAREAHRLIEAGEDEGKIVLDPTLDAVAALRSQATPAGAGT
jgi:NADPH:quinone reductase-like Zn-dependent oxidoreductase